MFCTHCGTQMPDNARFCTHCGTPFAASAAPMPPVPAAAPPRPQNPNSRLIKAYAIPAEVRKQFAKYLSLELYSDRLIGKGGPNGDITYFFKNYIGVKWTPASVATQYAQIVFITNENASNYVVANNLNALNDANKIPFCSGMFSYAQANEYTKMLFLDIKAAMDAYTEEQMNAPAGVVRQALSPADEIRKYKELFDAGIITEEQFEAKKNQLLGL